MKQEQDDMPLHLKYRPADFPEMVGNDATLQSLVTVLRREAGKIHSFLFIGPSGCGKTTLARLIKKEMNCKTEEFREYNVANVRGIDTIRAIAMECRYAPLYGKVRIYLLDEAHKLTNDAQNAILKLLEDTPEHVYFILCTTDPEKLIKTIRNRCATFNVTLLNIPQLAKLAKTVAGKEGITFSKEIITKIATSAQGSPRQALLLLDQIIDMTDEQEIMLALENVVLSESAVIDLCRYLLENKSPMRGINICKALQSLSTTSEPEQIRRAISGYLKNTLLKHFDESGDRVAKIMAFFQDSVIYSGMDGIVLSCFYASKL